MVATGISAVSLADFAGSYRFSAEQHHDLLALGLLTDEDVVDGYVLLPPGAPSVSPRYFPRWGQLRRWTTGEYRRMVEANILTTHDKLELLDGYLVRKMPQNDPHLSTMQRLTEDLIRSAPDGWRVLIQLPIELLESDPEPDAAIVRGGRRTFDQRKPTATDFGIVIEVADTTLRFDRTVKLPIYAAAGIPMYWIINLVDRQIEVYTEPDGNRYRTRKDYTQGESVPLSLDGTEVASLSVAELLP